VEQGTDWSAKVAAGVGERVAYFRALATDDHGRKLTAQGLADRCDRLGLPIGRPTIAKLEKGLRQTITVGEVQVLASALGVPPILLLFPLGHAEKVEVLPGRYVETLDAVTWFTGSGDAGDVELFKTHRTLVDHWPAGQKGPVPTAIFVESMTEAEQKNWRDANIVQRGLRQARAAMRARGLTPPGLPAELAWIDNGEPASEPR
jgi:transcriptional regulator with XRE-family HTH domain